MLFSRSQDERRPVEKARLYLRMARGKRKTAVMFTAGVSCATGLLILLKDLVMESGKAEDVLVWDSILSMR
jgi:hypothetical protein